jgi:hypothetical protein
MVGPWELGRLKLRPVSSQITRQVGQSHLLGQADIGKIDLSRSGSIAYFTKGLHGLENVGPLPARLVGRQKPTPFHLRFQGAPEAVPILIVLDAGH